MPDEHKGACASCGFLSKFDLHYSGPPPNVYEMPPRDRTTGERTQIRLESGREITGFPWCYVNAANIWGEMDASRRTGKFEPQAALDVFNADRQCPEWYPYTQGFSPQEHFEKIRQGELELERQQFERRMADQHKDFMCQLDKGNKRIQLILAVVLGGIALLEIGVGLLQVLYPAGFPWLQSLFGILPPPPLPPMPEF